MSVGKLEPCRRHCNYKTTTYSRGFARIFLAPTRSVGPFLGKLSSPQMKLKREGTNGLIPSVRKSLAWLPSTEQLPASLSPSIFPWERHCGTEHREARTASFSPNSEGVLCAEILRVEVPPHWTQLRRIWGLYIRHGDPEDTKPTDMLRDFRP